jgi:hypothetical protein
MKKLGFIIFLWGATLSQAGEMAKLGKKGVVVEMTSNKEFREDDRVCFYKNGKNFACGRVTKIKNKLALVKVKKKSLQKLNPGMIVKLKKGSTAEPLDLTFYGSTAFSPLSVFSNNVVGYIPAGTNPDSINRWQVGSAKNSISHSYFTLAGVFENFHFGVQFPISNMVPPIAAEYDYDIDDPSKYLSLNISHKVFGVFTDYLINIPKKKYDLFIGAGIGYISDTVSFNAFQLQDGTTDKNIVLEGKSSLTILTLRIPALISYDLEPIRFIAGSTLILGLSGTPDSNGEILDPASVDRTAEYKEFIVSLAHTKKLVGLDIFAGVGMNF